MTTKYLMIDDEPSAESYAAALAGAHPSLEIDSIHMRDPIEIVSHIGKVKPNGLIVDLELTRSMGKPKEHFKIEGTALAQQFRTQSNALSALIIPMVSLSQKSRRERIIGRDTTANDLFDLGLSKSDISNHAREIASKLVDLTRGYKKLSGLQSLTPDHCAKVLGLTASDHNLIDARVDRDLLALSRRPTHNIAHFLLHTLLPFSGPLINTEVLAVRLGIDTKESGNDWEALQSKLPKKTQYKGVFSESHVLWWMVLITHWWRSLKESPGALSMLSAEGRVEFLKKYFDLRRLKAIQSSTKSPGKRFWTVCERTGVPVDPSEGYAIVDDDKMRSWHDNRYVSRNAALRYVGDTNFEPGETDRLKKFGKPKSKKSGIT